MILENFRGAVGVGCVHRPKCSTAIVNKLILSWHRLLSHAAG
jgi:hypothetical protein